MRRLDSVYFGQESFGDRRDPAGIVLPGRGFFQERFQTRSGGLFDCVEVVSAFEREHKAPPRKLLKAGGQRGVAGRRNSHGSEQISGGGVEASRDENEIGLESPRDRKQHAVESFEIFGVPHSA